MLKGKVTGIIWVSPFYAGTGYCSVATNCVLGLNKIEFPVRIINEGPLNYNCIGKDICHKLQSLEKTSIGKYPVCIVFHTPELYSKYYSEKGIVKNIGVAISDTDRITNGWVKCYNLMDEIWVPTKGHYDVFLKEGVKKREIENNSI